MKCEHQYGVVFDNELTQISDYLSLNFPGFNFLSLAHHIAVFAESHELQLDSVAAGVKNQTFRMEWLARDDSVYDFLLDRTLLIRQGIKIAVHELFTLPSRLQGRGLAKIILQGFYEQYRSSSIQRIELVAGKIIGGYVWALYGFEATDPSQVRDIIELGRARPNITNEESGLHLRIFEGFYASNPSDASFPMRELATSPGGEALLKSTSWLGALDLQNQLQCELFETHLGLIL